MVATEARSFGYLLRHYRLAALLTQEQLADQAHLSYRTISDLERGVKHTPRRDTVLLLADALELSSEARAALIAAAHPSERQPAVTKILAEQVSPSGSIRTFLVADLRGYANFTLEQADEEAARPAARFAALCREVVTAREGVVLELRGDEFVCVFASARQALRAAAELQGRFRRERELDASLLLQVGVGLDAGEAVPVEAGYQSAALHLAARLCTLTGPGEVLASEAIVHLARKIQGLSYVDRGEVQLKGFADPVRVVQIAPENVVQTRSDGMVKPVSQRPLPIGGFLGALPATPLVAREDELRSVLSAVDAAAGGSGRLVFLTGEPGVGKTRLAQEVTLHLRNRGFLVASGRCYEPHEAVPFYPFLEALESLYLAASPSIRSALPQRWPYLGRLLPSENLPVPPSSFEGKEAQERLFWSVTGFLQTLAQERRVALLVDDLHWADASSLALLQHLARHTRAHGVLLLGTYRDVEARRHHLLELALRDLGREQLAERVPTKRLGQEGTRALIATSFGEQEVSTEFVELVYRHTEGNPFFVHEVLRTLVERGDVYREGGRWERREIRELAVPESIRSAVGERLSRLRVDTQQLLHEASVLGQVFNFDDLQAMRNRGEEEVEQALEEAEAAGLVRATEKDSYSFNHVLTQQALYAEFSSRRRRQAHLAAGQALEQLPERKREQRVAELALHFLHGDDPEGALPYVLQAGDQAEAVFAHAEAEGQYRRGLELARQLEDRAREAEALEKLGRVLVLTGRFDEALEGLERAVQHYRAAGDREGEARTTLGTINALRGKGRTGEAGTRLKRMLEAFEGAGASPVHAKLYLRLTSDLFNAGKYEDMLTAAHRAAELARAVGDDSILANVRLREGLALNTLGRMNSGGAALEEAATLLERLGEVLELRFALSNLGDMYLVRGKFTRTRRLWERVLVLEQQVGEPSQTAFAFGILSEILFYLGDWAAARAHAERAAGCLDGSALAWQTAYPPLYLGMLDLARGSWEEGEQHLAACLAVAEQYGDLQALRYAHRWLAERDLLQGRPGSALGHLEPLLDRPGVEEEQVTRLLPYLASAHLALGDEARAEQTVMGSLDRASRQGHQLALVDLLRVQGVLRARQRRWEEAEQALAAAVSLARGMPYPYADARALFEWARMLRAKGEPELARERLEEALAIFRRLGAHPYIERAEEMFAVG